MSERLQPLKKASPPLAQPPLRHHRHNRREQKNHQKYRQLFPKRIPRARDTKIHIHHRHREPHGDKRKRRQQHPPRRIPHHPRRRDKNSPNQKPAQNYQHRPHLPLPRITPSLPHRQHTPPTSRIVYGRSTAAPHVRTVSAP